MEEVIAETTSSKPEKKQGIKGLINWMIFILFLAALFFTVRFAVGFIIVEGESMAPTIADGDIFLSNNMLSDINYNDIIVFKNEKGFDVIKRVIALPHETVQIEDGKIFVDGTIIDSSQAKGAPADMDLVTVPGDAYFVMGDNRDPGESLDSRDPDVGAITKERIKGEIIWSIKPFGNLP